MVREVCFALNSIFSRDSGSLRRLSRESIFFSPDSTERGLAPPCSMWVQVVVHIFSKLILPRWRRWSSAPSWRTVGWLSLCCWRFYS